MKRFSTTAVVLFLVCIAWPALSQTAEPHNFIGEKLVYEFGWSGFTAAKADISIGQIDYAGHDCYKLRMKIRSLARLEWIWKVRDEITSYCRKSDLTPERFFYEQREGNFHLDTEILHDHEDKMLRSTRKRLKDGKTKTYKPKWAKADGILDPLGALLKMRMENLEVGKTYALRAFDGKRSHDITYTVEGTETIDTRFGKLKTFKVYPKISKSSGSDSDSKVEKVQQVTAWITTTPDHNVVRIESKVFIGKVFVELVEK